MALHPCIETKTYDADSSPAASTKEIFYAPYGCTIVGFTAKRTGGTGAVVKATVTRSGTTSDLLTANKSLTTTAYAAGTLDSTKVKLAAGDTITAEIVSVAGSPTAVRIVVVIQWDSDAR